MSCPSSVPVRTFSSLPFTIFSKGGSPADSDIFVMTPEQVTQMAPLLAQLRVTPLIHNASALFKCKAVFQTTDDGNTWGNPIDLETGFSAVNRTTPWYSTVSNFGRGIRVGLIAGNVSGTSVEMGRVTLVFDLLLRS